MHVAPLNGLETWHHINILLNVIIIIKSYLGSWAVSSFQSAHNDPHNIWWQHSTQHDSDRTQHNMVEWQHSTQHGGDTCPCTMVQLNYFLHKWHIIACGKVFQQILAKAVHVPCYFGRDTLAKTTLAKKILVNSHIPCTPHGQHSLTIIILWFSLSGACGGVWTVVEF